MTCIAAIADGSTGWMAGDRLVSWNIAFESATPKIWKVEKHGRVWLFGNCGKPHAQELLQHSFTFPEPVGELNVLTYLIKVWSPAAKKCLREGGALITKEGAEKLQGSLLIVVDGELFSVDDKPSITQHKERFFSVGSGSFMATGILAYMDKSASELLPPERLRKAIEIASIYTPDVGGEIDIIHD